MINICYVYNESFSYLKNMFLESLEPSKNRIILSGKKISSKNQDSGFGSKSWYDCTRMKIEFLYEQYSKLKDNEIILCSDVDVYFKDSEKALDIIERKFKESEELDFIGMSENNNSKIKLLNTGFFAVKKNKKIDLLFRNVLSVNFHYFKFADQDVINLFLNSIKVSYDVLDNNQFTQGVFINAVNDQSSILVIHASGCFDVESKIRLIHKVCGIKYDTLMVVAKYQESVEWIKNIKIPHLIYNKSTPKHWSNKIEKLNFIHIDNIGFEEFPYLRFIVDNYHSLPNRIIFTQAEPFPHSPYFNEIIKPEIIWMHQDVQPMSNYWSKDVPGYILVSNTENLLKINGMYPVHVDFLNDKNQRYNIETDSFDWYNKDQKVHCYDHLFRFFDTENLRKKFFDILQITPRDFNGMKITPMCYAALISVKKEQILRHSLFFYEKLLELSKFYNHKYFAELMEMCWLEIFGYEPPQELYNKQKYQEFKTQKYNEALKSKKFTDSKCNFIEIPVKINRKPCTQYTCIYCKQNINQYDYLNSKHVYDCPVKISNELRRYSTKYPS